MDAPELCSSGTSRPLVLLCLENIHPINKAVSKAVRVMDHLVYEDVSSQIPHYLVNAYNNPAALNVFETPRVHTRVHDFPLASPILAHVRLPSVPPTFHAVGPVHVSLHRGQNGIDISGIEC